MKRQKPLSPDRLAVLEKIRQYEALGGNYYFQDVEEDPPGRTLLPEDVDYLHTSQKFRFNAFWARLVESVALAICRQKFRFTITGEENLANITGGAIFTSNHFAVTENLAVTAAARLAPGKHRLYKLVREGNYFMPGIIGWLLKYADTLPLSGSVTTMTLLDKAIAHLLRQGNFILVYPEQSMWWNYQKPRPYRLGAFYYAAKNGVPVVPCFVTLHQKDTTTPMLPDNIRYAIHILPPIFPDSTLRPKADAQRMLEENARLCRECYETTYGETL